LKFVISDTGCGISAEAQGKLFQKFSQVNEDPSKRKLGTGLGLYITRALCQKMNGDVRVYSQLGKGSTFIFCIPTSTPSPQISSQERIGIDYARPFIDERTLRALIVDDQDFNNLIVMNYLKKIGINDITVAKNGLEAYSQYKNSLEQSRLFDVVTMDVEMPIMDGKEAVKKIRQLEAEKYTKKSLIIMISGNCMESEITQCIDKNGEIGADYFLKKPVSVEDLLKIIYEYTLASVVNQE
jgi:CheY-like chemotaxis protein